MKEGWEIKRISDVCEIINGGTPDTKVPEYWEGQYSWITPKDMGQLSGFYVDKTARSISELGLKNSSAKILPINSIILSSRAPIGHLAINTVEIATNQGCKGLIPRKSITTKYLLYFLYNSIELLNSLGSGTTFKELSSSKLADVKLPLPPLPEQQRIIAILDQAFAAIAKAKENAERNLKNAREVFESYLNSVFANPGEDWEVKRLEEVIKLEYGKPLPASRRKADGVYPVYGANGAIDRTDYYYYDRPSIIVGRKGSAGEINLTEKRFWPLDVTYFVKYDDKILDLGFLMLLLRNLNLPKLAKGVKPGINRNEVYSMIVKIPTLAKQNSIVYKFIELSSESNKLETIYQQKIADLEELKKTILLKAFNGELQTEKINVL